MPYINRLISTEQANALIAERARIALLVRDTRIRVRYLEARGDARGLEKEQETIRRSLEKIARIDESLGTM